MRRRAALVALLLAAVMAVAPAARAEEGKVRAVLFFSQTCGHCEYVINELLFPVWFPRYGGEPEWFVGGSAGEDPSFYLATNGTLEILLVDIGTRWGSEFFAAVGDSFGLTRRGVPFLAYRDTYLIGSGDIPAQFPGVIEEGLASGGIDWPEVPGMQEALAAIVTETTTTTTSDDTTTGPNVTTTTIVPIGGESVWERFRHDTAANSLAVVVLALMALSLVGVALVARREGGEAGPPGMAVPLLALAGLAVAAYLAFVETSGSEAVCGPVGNCNAVQQSEWAKVLGIHIGVIGVAGYALALAAWAVARFAHPPAADWARVGLHAGAVAGTAFSIYLTFLEPFVIGATCLWCLSSAVIVTALMWLTARPAAAAWERLRAGD